MWRMRRLFTALLSLVASIAAAVAWTPVTGATPEYGAGPTPSSAVPQPSSAPQLNWGSCSQIISSPGDVPSAQCATVAVPVDYANPGGAINGNGTGVTDPGTALSAATFGTITAANPPRILQLSLKMDF